MAAKMARPRAADGAAVAAEPSLVMMVEKRREFSTRCCETG